MTTFTYGELSIDSDKFHPNAVQALLRRGLSHLLGNEQAAKVGPESAWGKANANATKEQVAAAKLAMQQSAIATLYDGTIGVRASSGPKADPLTSEMRKLAKIEIVAILGANKDTEGKAVKFPTGDKTVILPDGTSATGEQLIGRRLAKHGERIKAEASRNIAAQAKKAKQVVEAGVDL